MCDEHVDWWNSEELTARKWHECYECEGLIAPGDRYVKTTTIDNGSVRVTKSHVPCEEIAAEWSTDGESCRLLYERAETFIHENSFGAGNRPLALLRWMKIRSRRRFADALVAAFAVVP